MQKNIKAAAAILTCGLIWLGQATAQTWEWHTANGLAGTPSGMAFDASGGKWMSIRFGGLSHFDGAKWTSYNNVNTYGGIPYDDARAVAVDREGNKWVGSEQGVSKFDGRQWTRYTPESTGGGLPAGLVNSIVQDRKGNLWFGVTRGGDTAPGGVARFDGRTWTKYPAGGKDLPDATSLQNLAVDRDDNIWLAATSKAYMFNGTRWTEYGRDNTGGAIQGVFCLTVDAKGTVWIGGDGVLTRYENGRWTPVSGPYGNGKDPRSAIPDAISVDGDGVVWVAMSATNNPASLPGLFRYDGGKWTRYLLDDDWRLISTLATDPRGKLWATPAGLVEFDGTVRTHYNGDKTLTGVPWGDAEALAVDVQGTVWAGTFYASGAWDGRQWQLHRPTASRSGSPEQMGITQIATGPNNTTWFATWNVLTKTASFVRRSGTSWTTWTHAEVGATLGQVNGMAVDSKGQLWAATETGAFKFDGTRWTRFTSQNTNGSLLSNTVRGIAIDARDQVWFGTAAANMLGAGNEGGVSRFDGSTWANWTAASTGGALATNNIRAMQFDRKGRLWAVVGASMALRKLGGLAMFDGTRWQTLTAANDKSLENDIRRITADNKGGIWLAMDKGAAWYDGESKWQFFNRANTNNALTSPFPDTEILDIAVDKADNVWFSVKKGGLAVMKSPGVAARSTAQPEPQRVVSQLATFVDQPEVAAAKAAAAKAKADADKARADQIAAFGRMTKPKIQAKFCEEFGSVRDRADLVPLFTQYESSPYGVDEFLYTPACELAGLKLPDRGPAIHMLVDNAQAMSTFLPTIFVYYARRRKEEGLLIKAMNVQNTRGETMLDYLESRLQSGDVGPAAAAKFARYSCSKGAVYSKANKSCTTN